MSEIPDDVMAMARNQCNLAGVTPTSDMRVHCEHVAVNAILAERKRCAAVAQAYIDGRGCGDALTHEDTIQCDAADEIKDGILKP